MNGIAELLKTDEAKHEVCNAHGEFISRNLFRGVWSRCPQCAADKQAIAERESHEKAAAERHHEWQRLLGEAAIPDRFRDRTLERYIAENAGQKRALDFALSYVETFDDVAKTGRSAIFCGKPGTGKTHLAVGVGLEVMETGRLVMFTTAQRAFRRMKDTFNRDSSESLSAVIRLLVQPDLLIIDEIGVQFGSKFEEDALFDLMNERYEKRRPSLLLSNLEVREVKAFIGERVYDRLREDGAQCVPFDWASHRGVA